MALRKKIINKESMFNKIMPSLSREENEEEIDETLDSRTPERSAGRTAPANRKRGVIYPGDKDIDELEAELEEEGYFDDTPKKAVRKPAAPRRDASRRSYNDFDDEDYDYDDEPEEERPRKTVNKAASTRKNAARMTYEEPEEDEDADEEEDIDDKPRKAVRKPASPPVRKPVSRKAADEFEEEDEDDEFDEEAEERNKKAVRKPPVSSTARKPAVRKPAAPDEPEEDEEDEAPKRARKTAASAPMQSAQSTQSARKKPVSRKMIEEDDDDEEELEEVPRRPARRPAAPPSRRKASPRRSVMDDENDMYDPDYDDDGDEYAENEAPSGRTPERASVNAPKTDKSVPRVSAYARQLAERRDDRDNGDYSEYEVININEELMKLRFNDVFDKFHCCHCNACRFTVMALSLNILEAKYIAVNSSERDEVIKKADDSHIKATIIQSILKLMINPIH